MKLLLLAVFLYSGGIAPYSQRGEADFDIAIDALHDIGSWKEIETYSWVFVPSDPNFVPYRDGKWFYSDYGWVWKGNQKGSWVTDHYGYWRKIPSQRWVWIPGTQWHPAAVQWKETTQFIGWIPADKDYTEQAQPTVSDASSWNFVPKEKFIDELRPEDFAPPARLPELLKQSSPCDHVYVGYREIRRQGPDCDTMKTYLREGPFLRTVKSLATPDQQAVSEDPADLFFYRPEFYQDQDGIRRRIQIRTAEETPQETPLPVDSEAAPPEASETPPTPQTRPVQWTPSSFLRRRDVGSRKANRE